MKCHLIVVLMLWVRQAQQPRTRYIERGGDETKQEAKQTEQI